MISGVPVERVEDSVEGDRVQEFVYGLDYFRAVLACRAFFYVERARYEVVLHVNDQKCTLWSRANFDPFVPAHLNNKKTV